MPRMDGREALREIKSDEELRRIPVVVLTSSQEEQDVVQSYRLGVNSYIVKPVDFEKFRQISPGRSPSPSSGIHQVPQHH